MIAPDLCKGWSLGDISIQQHGHQVAQVLAVVCAGDGWEVTAHDLEDQRQ